MAGTGCSPASSGSQIRAARRVPSAIVIHSVSMVRTRRGNSVTTCIGAFNPTSAGRSSVGGAKLHPTTLQRRSCRAAAAWSKWSTSSRAPRWGCLPDMRPPGWTSTTGRARRRRLCLGAGGREQLAEAVELLAGALVHAVQGDLELEAERLEQRLRAVLERERERQVLAARPLAH